MSGRSDQSAWQHRELHFIAIGGAGMSGLAAVCHRLGARVTGSDRTQSSYLRRLRDQGLEPRVGHDADFVPEGSEVVVSTAIAEDNPELVRARERGQRVIHRGELLAELCSLRRLIAVSGTHGKTTTAGMLVHALRGIGADPAFFLGGELPGAGPGREPANAGWGAGEWVVAEADESDASFLELRPEVAAITNVELDHHSRWGSRAELLEAFGRFAAEARGAAVLADPDLDALCGSERTVRFDSESPGPALALRVPGGHNVLNARAALAALELAGGELDSAAAALESFPGMLRRQERKGSRDGAEIYDDYAHHPTEVVATLAAMRELEPRRLIAVFQPHLYSRTRALAGRFGAALAAADEIAVLDVYPAREQPVGDLAGVQWPRGRPRGRRPCGWAAGVVASRRRDRRPSARSAAGRRRPPGDDRGRRHPRAGRGVGGGRALSPTPGVERGYPLARLTTVRAGGDAEFFARPETEATLIELLAWAQGEGIDVEVVGSGSNLLVSDTGVRGLVLKLSGELATIERHGTRLECGGGARLPSASAKAAGWGLGGLEFGINIPGTVGGAVRMNANAYGGQLGQVLEWVVVCTAAGSTRRNPVELGFAYRSSNLRPGEVVSRAAFGLTAAEPAAVKAILAEMRGKRREAQPSGIKTFGSTFKNPDDPRAEGRSAGQLLDAAGCQGLAVGGARLSPKHANFVENTGSATTADVLAVMAEGRRRVHERFGIELEPEVQVLGEFEWPQGWEL